MNPRIRIFLAIGMLFLFTILIWKPTITGKTTEEIQQVVVILKAHSASSITGAVTLEEESSTLEELKISTEQAQQEVLEDVNTLSLIELITGDTGQEVEQLRTPEYVPAMIVEATPEGIQELQSHPLVEAVYPNIQFELALAESAPLINADDVWPIQVNGVNVDGTGQSVCVIDTGILPHTSFQNRIVDQKCYCTSSCCPNGQTTDTLATDVYPTKHGTHVSGIIAANGTTYKGIAPGANIVAVKVCGTSCGLSDIISGIDYCLQVKDQFNVVAISGSIGDGGNYQTQPQCPTYFDSAINAAYNAGITSVFATGNNGYAGGISYPGCTPNGIAVGATDKSNVPATFSNRGPLMEVWAPGVSITSTVANNQHAIMSGTSQATPHVSGAVALLKHYASLIGIQLTPDQIKQTLQDTGVTISGYKRIDVLAAIQSLTPPNNPPIATITSPANQATVETPVTLEGSATDAEDGTIPAESLSWESNIDGQLGTGSTLQTPLTVGNHTITLTATDTGALSDQATIQITVQTPPPNTPPIATITNPANQATVETPVTLEGSATDAEDGNLTNESLSWASNVDGQLGTGNTLQTPLTLGVHTITLTATDSAEEIDTKIIQITVQQPEQPNQLPNATITTTAGMKNSPVTLQGSATDVEDGNLPDESLSWTSNVDGLLGNGSTLQTPLTAGIHTITLTATDSQSAIDTEQIQIQINTPPTATITNPTENQQLQNPINFQATANDAEDGTPQISWKEGPNVLGTTNPLQKLIAPGIHTITLETTDSLGLTTQDQVTFTAITCHIALDNNEQTGIDIGDFVTLLQSYATNTLSCIAPQSGCIIELDGNDNGITDIGDFIHWLTAFAQGPIQDVNGQTC